MNKEWNVTGDDLAAANEPVTASDKIVAVGVGRQVKPRKRGLTMVIDKGLGLAATDDLLELAAAHIDFIKLGFGTSLLYEPEMLQRKLRAIVAAGVAVLPGGTLFEVAVHQGTVPEFFALACNAGFTHIEVSDGTIDLPKRLRSEFIDRARELGFGVLSEIGKKDPARALHADDVLEQVAADVAAGATNIVIEARDSGRSIGIYDDEGRVRAGLFEDIVSRLPSLDDIIWEAPQPAQQQALLVRLGPNVSLGNVQPADVIALEAMRLGLRGDTFRLRLQGTDNGSARA